MICFFHKFGTGFPLAFPYKLQGIATKSNVFDDVLDELAENYFLWRTLGNISYRNSLMLEKDKLGSG